MGKTLEIIENSVTKKKKSNISKNKKRYHRKIQIKDVEDHLQQQEEQERLGVLGEKTENLFVLEYDPDDVVNESSLPTTPLRYTVDPLTGLKDTGCTKKAQQKQRAVKEIQYATKGLPGKKPIARSSNFRVEHTKAYKDAQRKARLARTPKLAAKEAVMKKINEETARKSKVLGKKRKRMAPEDVWEEPEHLTVRTPAEEETDAGRRFIAPELDYTLRTLKRRPVKRPHREAANTLPALPLPDPGLSYQPTQAAYSRLLMTATAKESARLAKLRRETAVKNTNFPLGALPANELQGIVDMAPQDGSTPQEAKEEEGQEAREAAPPVVKRGRLTHQQKMKKKKRAARLQGEAKEAKRREEDDQWDSMEQWQHAVAAAAALAERRRAGKEQRQRHARTLPARFATDPGVEVALPDELPSSLRTLQPSSNPVTSAYNSVFRRGLMPGKAKKHSKAGRSALRLPPTRRTRAKTVERFEPNDFGIKL